MYGIIGNNENRDRFSRDGAQAFVVHKCRQQDDEARKKIEMVA